MGSFNRKGGSSFGNKGFGGRDGGDRKPLFDATCSKCGKACQVPFKPSGGRPVFCKDCFDRPVGGNNSSRPLISSFSRPRFEDKQMFDATCAKCGNKCQVPFRPIEGKPIFCSNCFEKKSSSGGADLDQLKQQFGMLHAKLDAILEVLSPSAAPQAAKAVEEKKKTKTSVVKEKAVKKVPVKKPVTKKKK